MGMEKEQFIADLYELKSSLVRPFDYRTNYIEPNITYVVIETLIATFMDKYKVKYRDVEEELQRRNNQLNAPHQHPQN